MLRAMHRYAIEKLDVWVIMEREADVPCDAEKGDNEPRLSTPHPPHPTPTLSRYLCHLPP